MTHEGTLKNVLESTGKTYFALIHIILVIFGIHFMLHKGNNERRTSISRKQTLTKKEKNRKNNYLETKKDPPKQEFINPILKWSYPQSESAVKTLVDCWMKNVEKALLIELSNRKFIKVDVYPLFFLFDNVNV